MGGRQGQKDAASQTRPISTAGGRGLREEPRLPKVKASAAATTEVGELSPPRCATNREYGMGSPLLSGISCHEMTVFMRILDPSVPGSWRTFLKKKEKEQGSSRLKMLLVAFRDRRLNWERSRLGTRAILKPCSVQHSLLGGRLLASLTGVTASKLRLEASSVGSEQELILNKCGSPDAGYKN
ncbi:hypothetical protein NDU88_001031 [Pleurodeles waltl]|uniref:Uncharacterized protein n=1 Tax=Pleurodeles waltl TaxID=8319 RepID=A0AAV7WH60_PLEWA|nr:hypothetical protein NDU88_001031 [Pleurodeles waltl]